MSVKIRKRLTVLSLIEKAREDFKEELEKTIAPEILKTIDAGNNPIKAGRQKKYSDSYLKQIKRNGLGVGKLKSPVNLKLTGDLHKSIETKKTANGIEVSFTDPKAVYHNEGTNKIPQRRLLPTNKGESFNRNIFDRIMDAIKTAIKKHI